MGLVEENVTLAYGEIWIHEACYCRANWIMNHMTTHNHIPNWRAEAAHILGASPECCAPISRVSSRVFRGAHDLELKVPSRSSAGGYRTMCSYPSIRNYHINHVIYVGRRAGMDVMIDPALWTCGQTTLTPTRILACVTWAYVCPVRMSCEKTNNKRGKSPGPCYLLA